MRTIVIRTCLAAVIAAAFGTEVSVSAQAPAAGPEAFPSSAVSLNARGRLSVLAAALQAAAQQPASPQQPAADGRIVRRLTADEAVKLAAENNLGIQIARINPRIQDLNVLQARTGWTPAFSSTFQSNSNDAPNQNFLAGAQGNRTSSDQFQSNFGVQQALPWGGSYNVGWDSSRLSSNSSFSTFSPQLRSSLALEYTQPLLRNWGIDNTRQQVLSSTKNREIADVDLRQTLATTVRTVRNAYWDLAYAVASLTVQQQSLDLALESERNTRARVEIGTTPAIDIIEAESEVATRREAVVVAQAAIATAEDALRALVFDPSMPDFWTIRIEPTDLPPFQATVVDADQAVKNALDRRTDLQNLQRTMDLDNINIRFFRNQTLPDVSANLNYGLQGLGGTQLQRGLGPFGPGTGEVTGQSQKSYAAVLADLFRNDFPNWTASLNISYPIGTSNADAGLARARLQYNQSQTQLKNQQLQVATQVRQAARQVQTNQQRVETTRASRQLAERRLEAEQRKFQAGTSTSFFVFQAQRDLALARNNELRAVLDYNRSIVDLETVQEVPLR
jgi:outer membrane protein TolC